MMSRFSAIRLFFLSAFLLVSFPAVASASFEMSPVSGVVPGRGGWSVASADHLTRDACVLTPARSTFEVGASNYYSVSGLNGQYFSAQFPFSSASFGFLYSSLKFRSVYRENVFSALFSRAITKNLFAGLKINYYGIGVSQFEEDIKTSEGFSDFDFGILYKSKFFNLGISDLSLNSKEVVFSKIFEKDENSFNAGIVFKPADIARLGVDCDRNGSLSAGIEIEVAEALKTEMGLRKNMFTMGFSVRLPFCWMNFSTVMNNEMGNAYFISVSNE